MADKLDVTTTAATQIHPVPLRAADAQDTAQSDESLMQAYQGGNVQAFDLLYERYRLNLYRFMNRQLVADPDTLNELFQDVWLKLISSRDRYVVSASFKTYLFQIAHNTIRDYFRRQLVRKIIVPADENEEFEATSLLPAEDMQYQQTLQKFRHALNELPAEQREVFLLKEEAELSTAQIADITHVSTETVKSRMRYALKRLRQTLSGEEQNE